jgi:16S rRNA processing protein RimM
MSEADDYLVIGVVTSVYGIKGWVKIKSFTEPMSNFIAYENCFFRKGKSLQAVEVEQAKEHGKAIVAKFSHIADRNDAEALGRVEIVVKASDLAQLDADEYYWHQLEGLQVYAGELYLGILSHLLETGSNDVLVVQAAAGSIDKRERLLPYRPEVVKKVDLASRRIDVEWDAEF